MSDWIIYHNPNCTKSRQTLARLEERGIKPKIVEYLKTPPTESELQQIVQALDGDVTTLVRTKEDTYQELKFSLDSTDSIVKNLAAHPSLLERPIVLHKGRAIIGRPPENIEKFFE